MSERLERVLAVHLHPRDGTPYWLERERELGFSLRERIRSIEDLDLLGPFDPAELSRRPYTDFVPRSVLARGGLLVCETGGTTGAPTVTAWSDEDFHAAFVQPFLERVDGSEIFNGGHWLWIGPTGPHAIGKAAHRIATLTTASDAFCVDFDPRWYRRLAPGSLARARYLEHVTEQALRVLARQDIRYLFATPPALLAIAARLTSSARERIRFVYLGGMVIESDALGRLGSLLPAARFLSGYGNTLFGVCHEAAPGRGLDGPRHYYAGSERLVMRVIEPAGEDGGARLSARAAPGQRGQVVLYRFDESGLLPGVAERDRAIRLPGEDEAGSDGIADPRPPARSALTIDEGIY